ncbi:MAG: hypothetical protein H7146_08495 [Burkholderiaceae bacterium]|nr:hypothetical protein [Microbacteriaceae bacterium]
MKRIFYASGSVVTGDRTADAVVRYAQALAQREASDMIDIPIFAAGGTAARAQLLIGPASQLMVVSEVPRHQEFDDEETLGRIDQRMEALLRPKAQPVDKADIGLESDLPQEQFAAFDPVPRVGS